MPNRTISKLTLYGDKVSGNCLKTLWTARHCGLDFDWIDVDIMKGETRTDAYLGVNPTGQVPMARWPDGRVLTQSNAIMIWMAEEAGNSLIPADAFARAQMHSWLFWEQYNHEPAIAVRRFRKLYLGLPDAEIDPALLTKGHAALAMMEMQLAHTDYLVGKGLTLADIALVAYTRVAPQGGFELAAYPGVRRWVHRIETDLEISHALEAA